MEEFVIQEDKTTILKANTERVHTLFGVKVTFTPNSHGTNQWVRITGSTKEQREKAKTYVASLCSNEPKRRVDCCIPPRMFKDLKNGSGRREIEEHSGAVLSFSESQAYLQGDDLAIGLALSKIEEKIRTFGEQKKQQDASVQDAGDGDDGDEEHDAINIGTVSTCDTAKDISPHMREFARKLLYSDKQIDAVVRTFGTDININKLLIELVKYSASTNQTSPSTEVTSMRPIARGPPARNLVSRGRPSGLAPKHDLHDMADQLVRPLPAPDNLRPIVIDGSNVAMHHGNQNIFSCRGIMLCVEYFLKRGHTDITVFVPMWRSEEPLPESQISDQKILSDLARQNILKFTPSRRSGNRNIVCYDDNFIVGLADKNEGIVVSNDNFNDLHEKNPKWRETIEQRTLGYVFRGDLFMPAEDPLGRYGPCLDDFLRRGSATHPKICPYLKNCTFGNRCRFYHPERDTQRQREKSPIGTLVDGSECSSTGPGRARTMTSTNQLTWNPQSITVGDPRVSPQSNVLQQRVHPPPNEVPLSDLVGDPRVSFPPTFQQEIAVRGRSQFGPIGPSYDIGVHQLSSEQYYPGNQHSGRVYSDYSRPPYPEAVYCPDRRFPAPLPPTQWSPYGQHPFPSPRSEVYPAGTGHCSYVGAYFEPAHVSYDNFQGQAPRDHVDCGVNSQDSRGSQVKIDPALVDKFVNIFKLDKETITRVLQDHPNECADGDVNKLADLFCK